MYDNQFYKSSYICKLRIKHKCFVFYLFLSYVIQGNKYQYKE